MKEFPYTELQRKWLDDLKTTDAPQTKYVLLRLIAAYAKGDLQPVGYCCLGRACVVAGIPAKFNTKGGYASFRNKVMSLPDELWKDLKLRSANGKIYPHINIEGDENKDVGSLTELNDIFDWSFKQIAELIENYPERVFTNLEE